MRNHFAAEALEAANTKEYRYEISESLSPDIFRYIEAFLSTVGWTSPIIFDGGRGFYASCRPHKVNLDKGARSYVSHGVVLYCVVVFVVMPYFMWSSFIVYLCLSCLLLSCL